MININPIPMKSQSVYLPLVLMVHRETPYTLDFQSVSGLYHQFTSLCYLCYLCYVYHALSLLFVPSVQNALSLGVWSLIGGQILSHLLFNVKSKACWLIKSSVLDSTILRERHKISIKRTLLSLLYSIPQQWFYSKGKNPGKDKTILFSSWLVECSNVINCKI